MKFSLTKNPGSEFFFINNPNLTKKILAGGRGGAWGVARVSDFFFFFFSNESKSKKKLFSF